MHNVFFDISTIELHYTFIDKEHKIDAFVQNECERAFLSIAKEISSMFAINIKIETELTKEGGIRKFFNFSENDSKSIKIGVLISIIAELIVTPITECSTKSINNFIDKVSTDKEISSLEKEKLKEEIRKLKLDNDIKEDLYTKGILKSQSDFYYMLNEDSRIAGVTFIEEDSYKKPLYQHEEIKKQDFPKYIYSEEDKADTLVESAKIQIISPILNKKNKNTKWKGVYNGNKIKFKMKSEDFITSVDEGLINFKNGFIINCNLIIEHKKDIAGNDISHYIVKEVLDYIIDDKIIETQEGKIYKQQKKDEEAQQELNFGDEE